MGSLLTNLVITVVTLPLSVTLTVTSNTAPTRKLCATTITKLIVTFLKNDDMGVSKPATTFTAVITNIVTSSNFRKLIITAVVTNVVLVILNVYHTNSLVGCVPRAVAINFASNITIAVLVNRVGSFFKLSFNNTEPIRTKRGIVRVMGDFKALS